MVMSDCVKLVGAVWLTFEKLIAPIMAATLADVVIFMGSAVPRTSEEAST
jgi:hypothetical protein